MSADPGQAYATLTGALSPHGISLLSPDRPTLPPAAITPGTQVIFRVHRADTDTVACSVDGTAWTVTQPTPGESDWSVTTPALPSGLHDVRCAVVQPGGAVASATQRVIVAGSCATSPQCDDGNPCSRDECVGGACTYEEADNCCATAVGCPDGNGCNVLTAGQRACLPAVSAACGDGSSCSVETWDQSGASGPWPKCSSDTASCPASLMVGCTQFGSSLANWQEVPAGSEPLWVHDPSSAGLTSAGRVYFHGSAATPALTCLRSPVVVPPAEGSVTVQFWRAHSAGPGLGSLRLIAPGQDAAAGLVLWTSDAAPSNWDRVSLTVNAAELPPATAAGAHLAWCVADADAATQWGFDDLCVGSGAPPAIACDAVISQVADGKPTDRAHGLSAVSTRSQLTWRTLAGPAFLQWYPALYNGHDDRWFGSLNLKTALATDKGLHSARIEVSDGILAADCVATVQVIHPKDVLLWTKDVPKAHWLDVREMLGTSSWTWLDTPALANVGNLSEYRAVVAVLGNGEHAVVPAEAEVAALQAYVSGGGRLVLQGGILGSSAGSGPANLPALLAELGLSSASAGPQWEAAGAEVLGYWPHPANPQSGAATAYPLDGTPELNAGIDRLRPSSAAIGSLRIGTAAGGVPLYAQLAVAGASKRSVLQSLSFGAFAPAAARAHAGRLVAFALGEGPSCAVAAQCQDGLDCTLDSCQQLQCVFDVAARCDDGNACTVDACTPAGTCSSTPDPLPCTDGQICTQGDQCVAGVCVSGVPVNCDDGNPCTTDTCQEGPGCDHQPQQDAPCDDGNPCTQQDACQDGACVKALAQPAAYPAYCGTVTVAGPELDPAWLAPGLPTDSPTSFQESILFLYQPASGTGLQHGMIEAPAAERVAVVRGRVQQWLSSGQVAALAAVRVRAQGHPEWGYAVTRADGWYDLVVAGGSALVIEFAKPGFLPAQRLVEVPATDFAAADDVVMVQPDSQATQIALGAEATQAQDARGMMVLPPMASTLTDEQPRQTMLVFPAGVQARRVLAGQSTPIQSLKIRLTEYTGGGRDRSAMPAPLPPATLWNYCVEVSDDEALASGASVVFDRPVSGYVDNLLGLPIGSTVPVGWYDRNDGVWKQLRATAGEANFERYLKVAWVLGARVQSGELQVYLHQNPQAPYGPLLADPADLTAWGFDQGELDRVKAWLLDRYGATAAAEMHTFWRFQIDHMTPYDVNGTAYVFNPPPPPVGPPDGDRRRDPPCGFGGGGASGGGAGGGGGETQMSGSIIGCDSHSLGEEIAIAGAGVSLRYDSRRVPGGAARYAHLRSAALGATDTIQHLMIGRGAVQQVQINLPIAETTTTLTVPGTDAYGRPLVGYIQTTVATTHGRQNPVIAVRGGSGGVGIVSEGALVASGCVSPGSAFGDALVYRYPDGGLCGVSRPPQVAVPWARVPPQSFGANQWRQADLAAEPATVAFSPARARTYTTATRRLFLGRVASPGDLGGWHLSGLHAYDPESGTVTLSSGYILSPEALTPRFQPIAGGGDQEPAALPQAASAVYLQASAIRDIAQDPEGYTWILRADDLLVVDSAGNLQRRCDSSAFGGELRGLAVRRSGRLLVASSQNGQGRVFEVAPYLSPSGQCQVALIAGGGSSGLQPFGPALSQQFDITDIAATADGAVYLALGEANAIWRLDPSGSMGPFAGSGAAYATGCFDPAKPARESCIGTIRSVAVDRVGTVYAGSQQGRLFRIHFTGSIRELDSGLSGGINASSTDLGWPVTGLAPVGDRGLAWCQHPNSALGLGGSVRVADVQEDGSKFGEMRLIAGSGAAEGEFEQADQESIMDGRLSATRLVLSSCEGLWTTASGRLLVAAKPAEPSTGPTTGNKLRVRVFAADPSGGSSTWTSRKILSANGAEEWEFAASGRHLATRNALTGRIERQFAYANGRLTSVTDGSGQMTLVIRNTEGRAIAIRAPGGQETQLLVDADGWLKQITDPAGGTVKIAYDQGQGRAGLLTAIEQPDGSVSTFAWDQFGRLKKDTGAAGNSVTLTSQFDFQTATRTSTATQASGRSLQSVWRAPTAVGESSRHVKTGADGAKSAGYSFDSPAKCTAQTCPELSWLGDAEQHAAHRVDVGPDGGVRWTLLGQDPAVAQGAALPTESWTRYNATLEGHTRITRLATPGPSGGGYQSVSTAVFRDGDGPTESDAPWTQALQTASDGSRTLTVTSPLGRQQIQKWNAQDQLVESGGPGMPTATYTYTAAGLPDAATVTATGANPEQRSRHWLWSAQQTLLATQAGTTDTATWFGYDAAGRVTQVQFADSSAGYTPRGNSGQVTSVAPPTLTPPAESGAPWSVGPPVYPISYGKGGMVQSESLPAVPPYLAWTTHYVYDQDRLLSQVVRLDGTVFGFFRDAVTGLPTQITAPDDAGDGLATWTLSHEATGARRLTGLANGTCELQYTYDGTLPHGETWACPGTLVNGAALVRSFDKRLRPKQIDLTVQGLTTSERRGFDLDDLPIAVTVTSGQADIAELQLIRDPQTGRLAELRLSAEPGVPTSAKRLRVVYSYDGFGDLLEKAVYGNDGTLLFRERYPQRDAVGRVMKRERDGALTAAQITDYAYHPQRGWLSSTSTGGVVTDAWSYDVRGNRLGKHVGLPGQVTGSADAQDRLLNLGAETLGYDLHGRVAARSGGSQWATYTWDAWGRLRAAVVAPMQPEQTTVTYRLDPAGRRIGRRLLSASGALLDERGWVYDGALRAVAEVDASGKLRARFVYATLGHSPDAVVTFAASGAVSGVYLLVHDAVGSPVITVNADGGTAVESVEYDAWGVATLSPGGTAVHPFGFAGGLWDRGSGLVRFGAREYDAGLGRWLARDPIGFGGGWNQYGYVDGNVINLVDPTGHWPSDPDFPQPPITPEHALKALDLVRTGFLYALYEYGLWKYPLFELFSGMQGDSSPNRLSCGARQSPDQAALNGLLKEAKKRGKFSAISEDEADTLLDWAREYFEGMYQDKHSGHKGPNNSPHIHAAGEDHIPFTPKQ